MNYIVLHHPAFCGRTISIRSQEQAQDLVEVAQKGDTLHIISDQFIDAPDMILGEIDYQLTVSKKYREVT